MRAVQHFLPDLGAVEANFYDESATLYVELLKAGEVRRSMHLSQLGVVQHAWPMARHTRWDASMVVLDLIRRTKELPAIHTGSKVRLGPNLVISSARELLQMWTLLLSLGHLHGTFASETELLFLIRKSASRGALQAELLAAVPADAHVQAWATKVLNQERTYQFFQLLAFYRLQRVRGDDDLRRKWGTVLAAYVAPRTGESEALSRARMLYQRIRRLAFMTLDASVTPSPVEIRLLQLATSPESLERMLSEPRHHSDGDEFESIERYLSRHIYNGRGALEAVANVRAFMHRRVEGPLVTQGLRYVVESAAANEQYVDPSGPDRFRTVVRGVMGGAPARLLLKSGQVHLDKRRTEETFERWARVVGAKASLQFARDATGDQYILQTFVSRLGTRDFAAAVVGTALLVARIRRRVDQLASFQYLDQRFVGSATAGIVEAALEHFFPEAECWEWREASGYPACVVGTRAQVVQILDEVTSSRTWSRARKHELDALRERVSNVSAQFVVVPLVNLVALDEHRTRHIAEIDGLIVGVDQRRGDLVMSVVEAKYQGTAPGTASRRQLNEALTALGSRPGQRKGRTTWKAEGRRGSAWVHLRSSYS